MITYSGIYDHVISISLAYTHICICTSVSDGSYLIPACILLIDSVTYIICLNAICVEIQFVIIFKQKEINLCKQINKWFDQSLI